MVNLLMLRGPRLFAGVALLLMLTISVSRAQAQQVASIRFDGDPLFSYRRGVQLTDLRPGDPFSPEAAQAAAQRLLRSARNQQYPLAEITWETREVRPDHHALRFMIKSGPRGRLEAVTIQGARVFSRSELMALLETQPQGAAQRLWRAPALELEKLERDRIALLEHYYQHGYMAADIGPAQVEWDRRLDGFRVTWPILHEGPAFTLGYVRFEAAQLPPPEILNELLPLRAGTRFDPVAVAAAQRRLRNYFYQLGHAFARVEHELDLQPDSARADVTFVVEVGVPQTVRSIHIQGNQTTREQIIRRELEIKTGQIFDPLSLELSQARLMALPMFRDAGVYYQGDRHQADLGLVVDVEERRTGRFETGFIYGEVEGGAFQANIIEQNLALTPPFRGAGLLGQFGVTAGPKIRRGDLRLLNPRIGYSRFSFDNSVYYEDSEFASELYNQRRWGGTSLLGHPLGTHHVVSAGFAVSVYEIYDIEPEVIDQIDRDETDIRLTSGILAWTWDRRNRSFRPTRGFRLNSDVQVSSEWLGGNTEVIQTGAGGVGFVNPFGDHVISLRARWRTIEAYGASDTVPVPLRLRLGGANDLRGFDYRSLGPRTEEGRLLGGGSAWWSSLEYMLPLGRWLDLAVYYQMGDVSADAFAVDGDGPVDNWGVGLLIRGIISRYGLMLHSH